MSRTFFFALSFYKVNDVQRFQYSKPFRKGPKNKDNEFAVSLCFIEGLCKTGLAPIAVMQSFHCNLLEQLVIHFMEERLMHQNGCVKNL